MRNPERISKILTELSEIWIQYPDLRLGQLLLNVINDSVLYYIEDEDPIKELKHLVQTYSYEGISEKDVQKAINILS